MATQLTSKSAAGAVKRRVAFRIKAEGAREVVVTGDFTGWSREGQALRELRKGEWTSILELAPGEYQYRVLVDGEWRDDPMADRRVPNPYGSDNCIMIVP